jgi:hypothetical protein
MTVLARHSGLVGADHRVGPGIQGQGFLICFIQSKGLKILSPYAFIFK